jgi:hypothetical protein
MKFLAATAFAAAALTMTAPAFAADTADLVNQCVVALDANGVAKADEYRARFVRAKGASSKTVTLKLFPVAGGEPKTAECVIKRGEVLQAALADEIRQANKGR